MICKDRSSKVGVLGRNRLISNCLSKRHVEYYSLSFFRASVFSYLTFVLPLFVLHLFFWYFRKVELRDYSIFLSSLIQSTPVISKSKGPSEIFRDIRSSTYQICRIEEKINRTTTFHKAVYNLTPEVRDILKILWKRGAISPLFHNILLPVVRFSCLNRDTIFSLRDKRLFEISEVEITRADCILLSIHGMK